MLSAMSDLTINPKSNMIKPNGAMLSSLPDIIPDIDTKSSIARGLGIKRDVKKGFQDPRYSPCPQASLDSVAFC